MDNSTYYLEPDWTGCKCLFCAVGFAYPITPLNSTIPASTNIVVLNVYYLPDDSLMIDRAYRIQAFVLHQPRYIIYFWD